MCEDSKFIRLKSCHSFLWKIDVDQGLGKLIEQLEQDDEALMKTSVLSDQRLVLRKGFYRSGVVCTGAMAFHCSTSPCSCPRRSIQTGGNCTSGRSWQKGPSWPKKLFFSLAVCSQRCFRDTDRFSSQNILVVAFEWMLWIDAFLTSCLELQGHLRPMDAQKVMQSWLSFWHSPEHPEPVMWLNDPGPIRTRVQSGFGRGDSLLLDWNMLLDVVGTSRYTT